MTDQASTISPETEQSGPQPIYNEGLSPQSPPVEEPAPTIEQLLEAIRKLGVKIDEMTETRRGLKKQAETMLKKL